MSELHVLHDDNHLLAVLKPAGIPTQPSGEIDRDNLEDRAKAWVKAKYQKPGAVFLHALHRLDTPVSGVVLFAKTSKALSRMNQFMREGKVHKTYRAWVEGKLPANCDELVHYLIHGDHRAEVSENGKLARLKYRVLEQKEGMTYVEIDLITGRYHQIRAQFSAIGCPVVGDKKYGSKRRWQRGIALCCWCMEFPPVVKDNNPIVVVASSFEGA